ncbi:putative disease resistance RPP13-like protein 1 [Durio zibethinus]|uniref:Disease resistance RPP13-like protein 1 n=1 Tax=Durio zibethinus TaxID=66656 RepID=A0A6P5Z5V4_DURZI|nr:putative disease resistance RPP13-like protein 1 [Durio zibethinus]
MGGIGKTTLAQFLYNDVMVKNHFNLRAWVYVSEEFDVFKVTKTIYESATLSHSAIKDLNVLQVKLERTLMGRKFLLVLDNVWNESFREWDLLRRPLQVGAPGSKIIVTTRSQSVSSTIHDVLVHDLQMLSKEDCWSLFAKHAFGDNDPDEDSTLKGIGEEIVKKCKGLPLAIKTLGSLLHSEVEAEEWNNLLSSRIWDLPDYKSDILPALRLSYHYLPSQLKRCFAYCSIFPKGHKFEKGDLVRMWIAEGLVQQPNSGRRMEEVGEQYFHELLSRSIFQQNHDQSRFIMHDLVNDLAQHIAGDFSFKFEHDSPPQNPARVRHLSCILKPSDTPDKFVAFYEKNKVLRTFLPLRSPSEGKTRFDSGVFKKLFPSPSCLRVLSLSSYNITEFPADSVGNLRQLRYLDLSGAAIPHLPESVGCLYNLETLKLSGCPRLTFLPANFSNLTKLEYLGIEGTPILQMPPNFGNLKRLQLLTKFVVGNNNMSTISEVKDLSLLRGTLSILRLQNVSQTADAEKANLKDKKYLCELIFEWDADPCNGNLQNAANDPQNGYIENAANVLDKLQPGENLERLKIKNFFGMRLPKWLGNASLSKIKSLTLDNCQNCNSLPPLGQLPSLKELTVHDLAGVKTVGQEFYGDSVVAFKSLETLMFGRMENWEEWLPFTNEQGFPSLHKLLMTECRKLTGIPIQLPSSNLHIDECDKLRFQVIASCGDLKDLAEQTCFEPVEGYRQWQRVIEPKFNLEIKRTEKILQWRIWKRSSSEIIWHEYLALNISHSPLRSHQPV